VSEMTGQNRAGYRLEGVCFRYPGRVEWAVRDLTLEVTPGDVVGVIGPNGSGKSTLLKMLAGLLRPQQGEIQLNGRPLGHYAIRVLAQQVAVVPQSVQFVFPFTVREIVGMGRMPHRIEQSGWWGGLSAVSQTDRDAVDMVLIDMELEPVAERSILELSGGERQKVLLARALVQQPSILLLDEPTASLDLHHQAAVYRRARSLNQQQGVTVVLVSHDLNLAALFARRLILLDGGRVRRIGSPDEVLTQAELDSLYAQSVVVDRHPSADVPRVTLRP
jgi:iron complex transport system ATP-binding protein